MKMVVSDTRVADVDAPCLPPKIAVTHSRPASEEYINSIRPFLDI